MPGSSPDLFSTAVHEVPVMATGAFADMMIG